MSFIMRPISVYEKAIKTQKDINYVIRLLNKRSRQFIFCSSKWGILV
jgi:hypothetical protein